MVEKSRQRRSSYHRFRPDACAMGMAHRDASGRKPEGRVVGGAFHVASQRIARLVLCFHAGMLVVLHGFIKKTQKTPAEDLTIAKRRMKEVTR